MNNNTTINTNVNMGNDLVTLPLKNFTASEMDIFLAICYKCQRQGSAEIKIPVVELRKLAKYKNVSNKEFMDAIELTVKKIGSLSFTNKKSNTYFEIFFPFAVFKFDLNTFLKIRVNDEFLYLFNDFVGDYTTMDIKESVSLSSSYSKCIYKMLRRFRNMPKPMWIVSLDDFKTFVDVPEGYSMGNINQRVLEPSIKELSEFFPNLRVEKIYSATTGRGRPFVSGLKFTFDKKSRSNNPDYESLGISVLDEPYI